MKKNKNELTINDHSNILKLQLISINNKIPRTQSMILYTF